MTGMILDGVLMVLLVAALGYGVRLEKKLAALRAGQQAFASAVTELNAAAGRAEAALASLRASGQETDLLHDRIVKAREVKAQLETLIAKGGALPPPLRSEEGGERAETTGNSVARPAPPSAPEPDDRALRMAALAQRIQGLSTPRPTPGRDNVAAIVSAMTANQSAKQNLNRARRNLDDDLFAA